MAQLLTKYNVLSAPVLDKERNQYIGFVDMVDLAAFIVDIYTETDIMGENFLSLLEQGERFITTKVKDLISTLFPPPNPIVERLACLVVLVPNGCPPPK